MKIEINKEAGEIVFIIDNDNSTLAYTLYMSLGMTHCKRSYPDLAETVSNKLAVLMRDERVVYDLKNSAEDRMIAGCIAISISEVDSNKAYEMTMAIYEHMTEAEGKSVIGAFIQASELILEAVKKEVAKDVVQP